MNISNQTKLFENLDEKQLLSIKEVAALLQVANKTVYGWIYRGLIPVYRVGPKLLRINRKELEEWASRNGGL